jgi:hypothetical protein
VSREGVRLSPDTFIAGTSRETSLTVGIRKTGSANSAGVGTDCGGVSTDGGDASFGRTCCVTSTATGTATAKAPHAAITTSGPKVPPHNPMFRHTGCGVGA